MRLLLLGLGLVVSVGPTVRRSDAQDTSAIDRGVRIGIVYQPGVRPGLVVLPGRPAGLDSARAMLMRDLDYSDRFELITLPAGDSLRVGAAALGTAPPARGAPGRGRTGGAQAAGPNYPLYLALGADFVVDVRAAGDTTVVDLHDVAARPQRRASAWRSTGWPTRCSRRRSGPPAWRRRASGSSRTARCT
ncbi:MAG: hypothetical protein AUJ00_07095 [Gemmatimonadetes bacterium 13_1_40CM_3_70_6]|nr:MAG: hypothetical protein AUJ00_07095 [Gemmatimonadetes bacterium 13_1_40CM_3_70_6]